MKKRLLNILFWSVIAAAFIGPGTVTTAASAGAGFGFSLLWTLVFSTLACVVLQEASARLTAVSGRNLGQAIRDYFYDRPMGKAVVYLVLGSIIFGCAAYETGNILGAIAGASLILHISPFILTLTTGILAAFLLWFGSTRTIAQVMGFIVAFMGICFLTTAVIINPPIGKILQGSFIPAFPDGSALLILALIGTTVVPYNLFLGSGLRHTQSLREMRLSLALAIIIGGVISIGVLIVGTSIAGTFTFEALAHELELRLGSWAAWFLGFGLFAAGFSSALTAPLAAAITARSLRPDDNQQTDRWQENGSHYRLTWILVLAAGLLFGLLQVKPIPAIILAQALNGIILPIVAIFLLLMVNNAATLTTRNINAGWYNYLMGFVVFITLILGITNLFKALAGIFYAGLVNEELILGISMLLAVLLTWPIVMRIRELRDSAA